MIAAPTNIPLVALDASIFIYYFENHPQFAPIVDRYFAGHDAGQLQLVTSALTLLEVTVLPLRQRDADVVNQYEEMLSDVFGIRVVDIDRSQLMLAATLRADFRLKTPDALQIAAALSNGCVSFITNDKRLPIIPHLEIVQLSDLVS